MLLACRLIFCFVYLRLKTEKLKNYTLVGKKLKNPKKNFKTMWSLFGVLANTASCLNGAVGFVLTILGVASDC